MSKQRKIVVTKDDNENRYFELKYRIGNKQYQFPIIPREIYLRNKRIHPKYSDEISECKKQIEELISLGWLSVHRELLEEEIEENYYNRKYYFRSPVDKRIEDLLTRLSDYYLNIELEANNLSKKYQSEVLAGLLYNKEFDQFSFDEYSNSDPENIKEGLIHAYRDLNALNDDIEKRIDNHTNVIADSLENLKKAKNENEPINLNDVLPIVLLKRTNHIINLSQKLEKERTELFKPINEYISQLSSFVKEKNFEFTPGKSSAIRVTTAGKELRVNQLSSGEKQLFILLTETLLQKNRKFIFIADEPELSLHIEWQKKLLESIKNINKNAQIIVATHSPEIAALWKDSIIKMENIID
jgi:predicted ATP-dependent endonuclease of OLD family